MLKKVNYVPVENLATNLDENIILSIDPIKTRGRPKKYSTVEEARLNKIKNTIASAKKRKEGKGVIKNIIKTMPKVKKAVKSVTNIVNKVKDTANAVIYGRDDYSPKVRDIISKYGDKNITNITLGRTPLGRPLMAALQVASGNTFSQKLDNTPYDKLFHLFMCIELDSNSKIILEKNEVINADIGCKNPKDTETREITNSDIETGLTLNEALEKTQLLMGSNFFTYSAKDNNCQDFIIAFLTANNIGNETDKSWVKQETKVLFEGNDRLRKIANTFTTIGARFDVLKQGAGLKKKSNNNIKMANSWVEYVKAYAKNNNMKYNEALKDPKLKEGYQAKSGGKLNILKEITNVGKKLGEPFKKTTGVNPFTLGYDLGHDVIAPELKKTIRGKGIPTSKDAYIAELYDQANLGANGSVKL